MRRSCKTWALAASAALLATATLAFAWFVFFGSGPPGSDPLESAARQTGVHDDPSREPVESSGESADGRSNERPSARAPVSEQERSRTDASREDAPRDLIKLTIEKQRSVGLHTTPIERRRLHPSLTVPGKLDYNRAQYLEIKSPADGVVRRVFAQPGGQVQKGEHLATMLSPEVGEARDGVKHAEAELALGERKYAWAESVATNVSALLKRLDERPAMTQIEAEFKDRPLGKHREAIVAAYSKLLLAEFTLSGSAPLGEQGVISERTMQERRSQQEVARASFQSACETSRYEADLQRDTEKIARDHGRNQLELSREKLRTLFGPESDNEVDEAGRAWGEFELHASFSGVLAERRVVDGERIAAGQPLFTIADVSRLYVTALLRQQQWQMLDLADDAEITFRADADQAATHTARVRYVASLVSPDSHSLPLTAEFDNSAAKLKPGMFVWVTLPLGDERDAIVAPLSSLSRHEDEIFVFVRETADLFRRVPVRLGQETDQGVEVVSPLESGLEVVDNGVFALKSEWLLDTLGE